MKKIIAYLVGILILLLALIFVLSYILTSRREPRGFKGPSGSPYITGPTSSPPGF